MRNAALLLLLVGCEPPAASVEIAAAPSSHAAVAPAPSASATPAPPGATCAPRGTPCVWIKTNPAVQDDTALGHSARTDLWIHDAGGDRLLAAGRPRGEGDDIGFTDVAEPKFSPDGTRLFVSTGGWVVSSAVQEVDLKTGKPTLVIDGEIERFEVVGGKLTLIVGRNLLDLDHDVNDPQYQGRTFYHFRVDPTTREATRL